MVVRVQVSPLPPLFITLLMAKLQNYMSTDGKLEGTKFGSNTVRKMRRKRQRAAAKTTTPKLHKQNNNGFKNA